jgi:hypothetical protein
LNGYAGEQSSSAFSDANAGSLLRKNRNPRRGHPREAASTVRDIKGGIRTRFSMSRSIRNLHHRHWLRRMTRRFKSKNKDCRGALEHGAPPSEPLSGSPRHRWTAPVKLARRSLRRAPRLWRAHICASPGSGSPVPAHTGRISNELRRKTKTLRSVSSGGSVKNGLSISPRRDRSHEPSLHYRAAYCPSIIWRCIHICVASFGSCSLRDRHDRMRGDVFRAICEVKAQLKNFGVRNRNSP